VLALAAPWQLFFGFILVALIEREPPRPKRFLSHVSSNPLAVSLIVTGVSAWRWILQPAIRHPTCPAISRLETAAFNWPHDPTQRCMPSHSLVLAKFGLLHGTMLAVLRASTTEIWSGGRALMVLACFRRYFEIIIPMMKFNILTCRHPVVHWGRESKAFEHHSSHDKWRAAINWVSCVISPSMPMANKGNFWATASAAANHDAGRSRWWIFLPLVLLNGLATARREKREPN